MITTGLFLALMQTTFVAADVAPVVDAVIEAVAPLDGTLGGRPTAERPLFVDVRRTTAAFEPLVPSMPSTLPRLQRRFEARDRESVILCGSKANARTCRIADDGLFVAILSAERFGSAGEYRLVVQTGWNLTSPTGFTVVSGFVGEVFIARVDGAWRVVRTGKSIVGG